MTRPVRIQLSRKARFNLQRASRAINGLAARNCARPGKFGNGYRVGPDRTAAEAVRDFIRALRLAVNEDLSTPEWARRIYRSLDELRGQNLGCWCGPDDPCHADVLIELANPE